jgi:outer membrane lipoprotein-sorting protein
MSTGQASTTQSSRDSVVALRPVSALRLVLALLTVLAISRPAAAQEASARSIMERADALMRGDTQQGSYEMTIVRPDWQRTTRLEFWSEGTDKSFMRIESPAKDRGVTFLKIGREMWNYIPRVNRVIKIPPSMMLQSWMGSDFTNDDLVKESSVVDDYTHRLLGVDTLDTRLTWRIELVPKEGTPVAWDRVVEWIDQEGYWPLRAEYFNERGERVRTMLFSDVRRVDGRRLPLRMELIEDKKPGNSTILQLEGVRFDRPISARVFTQQNLRRGS